MKKSLLVLLPAVALIMSGCSLGGGDATSAASTSGAAPTTAAPTTAPTGTTTGTKTSEVDPTNYGTLDNPLTVTEALAIAAVQCQADGQITKQRVYTTGIVVGGNESNYGWNKFYIAESLEAGAAQLYAYSVNKDESGKMGYPNDTVIVEGFIKNYQGTIEYANSAQGVQDYPTFAKIERGTSAISVEVEHATVDGLGAEALNASEQSFTVTPDANYVVDSVKVNNKEITATEGVYSFVVKGDMAVAIETHEEGQPTEVKVYTLDGTVKCGTNGYATDSEVEQGDVSWLVTANTDRDDGWRFGGKNLDKVDRAATSQEPVTDKDVVKVVGTSAGMTITLNSVTLKVGTTIGGSELAELTIERNFTDGDEYVFEKADETSWANAYFTLVFNVSESSGSNKFVRLNALDFYALDLVA